MSVRFENDLTFAWRERNRGANDQFDMRRYRNLSGNSGVLAYRLARDGIAVQFEDGHIYLYTHASAGRQNVEHMKALAVAGKGLSTFIVRHVRESFAAKLS